MSGQARTVLIVGASGLVGTAAAQSFLDEGWSVVTGSRRSPDLLVGKDYRHVSLDLQNADACKQATQSFSDVTHVVYTAVYELSGLIQGWADPHQIETNGRMLRNLLEPLSGIADLQHVTVLQGTKAYGITVGPMRVPARESQPRVEHANFYWLQEDYIKEKSERCDFAYTIFRPQLIVGPNYGVVMNLPPIVGMYAAIRQHEGLPFSYPGGPDGVWEAVDARLVGNACLWAATHPEADGEIYNLTNGEVFMWRDMWPGIADTLGVTVGADESISMAEYLPARSATWEQIVRKHNLQPLSMSELLGESHYYADFVFNHGNDKAPPPAFVSTVKIKQAGFTETWNSEESFCYWLSDLQRRKVLPVF